MNAQDRELLTGMGNCYEACHADFERTVEMVAHSRDRTTADVKATLRRLRSESETDPEFLSLRKRLPDSFPV